MYCLGLLSVKEDVWSHELEGGRVEYTISGLEERCLCLIVRNRFICEERKNITWTERECELGPELVTRDLESIVEDRKGRPIDSDLRVTHVIADIKVEDVEATSDNCDLGVIGIDIVAGGHLVALEDNRTKGVDPLGPEIDDVHGGGKGQRFSAFDSGITDWTGFATGTYTASVSLGSSRPIADNGSLFFL